MASVISNAKAAAGMAPGDRSPASSFSFGIYIFFLIDFFCICRLDFLPTV